MSAHKKMARSERAKQFMPFAALKGYEEALKRKEEEVLRAYDPEEDRALYGPADGRDVPGEIRGEEGS